MIQSSPTPTARYHSGYAASGHSLSLEAQAMAEDIKGYATSKQQARKMKASAVKDRRRASASSVKEMRKAASKSFWGATISLISAGLSLAGTVTQGIADAAKKGTEVAKNGVQALSKGAEQSKGIWDWVAVGLSTGGQVANKTAGMVTTYAQYNQANAAEHRAESEAQSQLIADASESVSEYNGAMQRTINRINAMQQGAR